MLSSKPGTGMARNAFLDRLPHDVVDRIMTLSERVEAPAGMPAAAIGSDIEHVLFPFGAVVSVVSRMRDGSDVETHVIGREGLFGATLILGNAKSSLDAMVQIPGIVYRLPKRAFLELLEEHRTLRSAVLSFIATSIDAIGQFAACNRLHSIEARAARWLLMAHDRVPEDEIRMTHEYLATMLGVRRSGVSVAAATYAKQGFIDYARGRILMLDRAGLERMACECYDVANESIAMHLGYDIRKRAT